MSKQEISSIELNFQILNFFVMKSNTNYDDGTMEGVAFT